MNDFMMKVSRGVNSLGFGLRQKSPEILLMAGIGGIVWASVTACKKTLELPEMVERRDNLLHACKVNAEDSEDGNTVCTTDGDLPLEQVTSQVQARFGLEVAKLYAAPVAVGALSIAAIVGSHCIMSRRYTRAMAAYVAVSEAFNGYRQRVKDRVGEEMERKIRFNIKDEETEEEVVNEKGKKKIVKKTVEVVDPEMMMDDFTAFFTSFTAPREWSGSMILNRGKIADVAKWSTERLKREKRLFINDVLRDLGIEGRPSGQFVGWIYDEKNPIGDNYVNIEVEECMFKNPNTGVNEPGLILEFNADGNIAEKAFKPIAEIG